MVRDYSGRRPVPKNRPRKQPVGIFILILTAAVSLSFAVGVLTGWFLFKPSGKGSKAEEARAASSKASEATSLRTPPANPETGGGRPGEPPLTFYETLPKGGKAVIGSGLNQRKAEGLQPLKPPVPMPASPQQAIPQPVPPAAALKADERKTDAKAADAAAQKDSAATKYSVQVASTQERKEAESLKGKLAEKGLPAYISESSVKDRGTWFRVRIGKHLSRQAAGELAAKAGKGAIVIAD